MENPIFNLNLSETELLANITNELYPNIIYLKTLTDKIFILRLNLALVNINNIINTLYKLGYRYNGNKNELNIKLKDNFLSDKNKNLNEYLDEEQKLHHLELAIPKLSHSIYKEKIDNFEKIANGKTIICESLTGKQSLIYFHKHFTVYQLKEIIQFNESIPIDQIKIIYHGKQLEDQYTLNHYNIQYDSKIFLMLKLRGGMLVESSGKSDLKDLTSNVIDIDPNS